MNSLGTFTIIKNGEDSRKNHAVFKEDSQQIIQAIKSVVEPIPTGNLVQMRVERIRVFEFLSESVSASYTD